MQNTSEYVTPDGLTVVTFAAAADWEGWLVSHHGASAGIWMKLAKKGGGAETVSYAQAIEMALCFGWIDGRKGALDEVHWLQRVTPRGTRSKWSRINRDKAQELIDAGRMHAAGLRQVELAQADGRGE